MAKKIAYSLELPRDRTVYEDKCPILFALDIIGGKWKLPVLWYLAAQKNVRYNALKRSVKGVTNMMLTKCLKELERDGLVLRVEFPQIPPHVEYSLTKRGAELLPALNQLYRWGKQRQKETAAADGCGDGSESLNKTGG